MVIFGDVALLIMLAVTGIAIIRLSNLFGAVMLAGIYSLLSAGLFVIMDAVDVAFTEAAVGAGISTVLLLGTLSLVGYEERKPRHRPLLPLFVVTLTGAVLIYGTLDIPPFGDPRRPDPPPRGRLLPRAVLRGHGRHPQRRDLGAGVVPGLRHHG
jgi:multicomponent Na+:H+ antiporter subunit B